jgi:hypothetical protein
MTLPTSDHGTHQEPMGTESKAPIQHNSPTDEQPETSHAPAEPQQPDAEMSTEEPQPESAVVHSPKAHTGWEATSVPMARCDFCQLAARGVVQKCSTCTLSICKECFGNGRLDKDPIHNIGEDELNWEPTVKPRVSRKGAAKGGKRRVIGGRIPKKRASGATAASVHKLERALVDDTPEGATEGIRHQPSRPPLQSIEQSRANEQRLSMGALPREDDLREPNSMGYAQREKSATSRLDQLPFSHPDEEESRRTLPPILSPNSPYPQQAAMRYHRESLQPSGESLVNPRAQHTGGYDRSTAHRLPDMDRSQESVSLPPIRPRPDNFQRSTGYADESWSRDRYRDPMPPREQVEWRQPSNDYRSADQHIPQSEDGSRRASYPHEQSHCLSPESPRTCYSHERNNSASIPLAHPRTHGSPGPTTGHRPERIVSHERTEDTRGVDEWLHSDELQGLASYLTDNAIRMRRRRPEWPSLDWCLREEIAAEWATGNLRKVFPADGEAYRFLLGATYIACVTLQLDDKNNAARDWLSEMERTLCERGRPPIRQLPTKGFLSGE